MMSEKLETLVREALQALGFDADTVTIERPADIAHGDYSTNAALAYAKIAGTSPRELAGKLMEKILETPSDEIKELEIAGPGFINFFLNKEAVRESISRVPERIATTYTDKTILVEHSSPNLFKPFHIGHLMNNIVGEFVARAVLVGGGKVTTVSFPSDISLGIAKAIFVIQKDGGLAQDIFQKGTNEIVDYLGSCYVRGVTYFKEHPEDEALVKEIANKLYAQTESKELDIYRTAAELNIEYFMATIEKLGSHFDTLIYESEAGKVGKDLVLANTPKVFTESEGAVVYVPDESRKDINTAVFINSEGNPTYEAKDLGLLSIKFERFEPFVSLFITDHEQAAHFRVVLDAASKIHPAWAERSVHVPHGRMAFKGQKMSSRLGGVPLALAVIDTVLEEVRERSGDKIAHLSKEEQDAVQWQVALSALRVAILRAKPGSNINFDPDTSLSFEGDSGPYLLYTHARASALLEKGVVAGFSPAFDEAQEVTTLERLCLSFEDVLRESVEEIAPQKLVTYLFKLAQEFNAFYAGTPIVVEGDTATAHRLAIVQSVKNILKKGVWVLGVEAPERM